MVRPVPPPPPLPSSPSPSFRPSSHVVADRIVQSRKDRVIAFVRKYNRGAGLTLADAAVLAHPGAGAFCRGLPDVTRLLLVSVQLPRLKEAVVFIAFHKDDLERLSPAESARAYDLAANAIAAGKQMKKGNFYVTTLIEPGHVMVLDFGESKKDIYLVSAANVANFIQAASLALALPPPASSSVDDGDQARKQPQKKQKKQTAAEEEEEKNETTAEARAKKKSKTVIDIDVDSENESDRTVRKPAGKGVLLPPAITPANFATTTVAAEIVDAARGSVHALPGADTTVPISKNRAALAFLAPVIAPLANVERAHAMALKESAREAAACRALQVVTLPGAVLELASTPNDLDLDAAMRLLDLVVDTMPPGLPDPADQAERARAVATEAALSASLGKGMQDHARAQREVAVTQLARLMTSARVDPQDPQTREQLIEAARELGSGNSGAHAGFTCSDCDGLLYNFYMPSPHACGECQTRCQTCRLRRFMATLTAVERASLLPHDAIAIPFDQGHAHRLCDELQEVSDLFFHFTDRHGCNCPLPDIVPPAPEEPLVPTQTHEEPGTVLPDPMDVFTDLHAF